MTQATALAIDIGGTKMAVATVDESGTLGWRTSVRTPVEGDADVLFTALAEMIGRCPAEGLMVCGVGSGGPMDRNGEHISPLNIPGWRDFPLRRRLAELTGLAVFVDNDAKALALGEGWKGAAVGVDDYLAMVVSTGVGGGIVLDGRLLDGA
jgi:glucokinase